MKTDILIIGNGYVSQHLQTSLKDTKLNYVVVRRADHDYTNCEVITILLETYKPTAVVNCSGYTGKPNVDAAETDQEKCQLLNAQAPFHIACLCDMRSIRYYHISSGCIYTGYQKEWTEDDTPNFGLDSKESSWYSKTKHAAELSLFAMPYVGVRLRMPFGKDRADKNLITKLLNYDNLVNFLNTKTYIPDLGDFLVQLIEDTKDQKLDKPLIYNYGCTEPLTTRAFTQIMKANGLYNPMWSWVNFEDLNTKANRSNCVLSMEKAIKAGYKVRTEEECLIEALS